jgi:hypothetical protein
MASGVAKAAIFTGITEPLHAALDDNWTPEEALQRLGSAALFMGITDALVGKTPLKMYAEPKDIPTPEQEQSLNLLEEHLQPDTKTGMAQAAVARSMNGQSFDPINDILGLDKRIVEHEAKLQQLGVLGPNEQLPNDVRADVLESMDNGTYKDPIEEAKKDAGLSEPKEESNKVTLPPQNKGQAGFINLAPIVQALFTSRISALQTRLLGEATAKPVSPPNVPLTEPEKTVTTLLQPYEKPTESVQAGPSSGVVGGATAASPQTKTGESRNKWGGLSTIRAGGASSLARGSRIRFRNPLTYEHGSLTFIRGASNKFVAARAPKGTFTPSSTKSFDTFSEAHNWLAKNGFTEAQLKEGIKEEQPQSKVTLEKPSQAKTSLQNKEKGFEVMEHEAPHVHPLVLRQGEEAQIARQKAINGLRKYGLELWSKDGGWYPHGVRVIKTGEEFEYGTQKFDRIYGKARELVESFIHKFRAFHDEVMLSDLAQNDKTSVSYMPHQLPKPLDKSEGYRLFTLHNRNAGAEPTVSWSHDPSLEAHAHLTILRDKNGKPYLAVHEAQAGYSGNLKPQEGIKMLADRMREYAQEQGMPLVLPSSKTAAAIYGRENVNATFSRAYSKGGYVRKGFAQALDSERPYPVTLEKLWNPMGDGPVNYEGILMPDDTQVFQTPKEIDAEENAKEPGYNQAINCVTRQ